MYQYHFNLNVLEVVLILKLRVAAYIRISKKEKEVNSISNQKDLIDYSSTKGAIVSFTRSLSLSLADMKIRVNAVAPGPVWTPLIPSSFSEQQVEIFGTDVPLKRAGEPFEIAPAYLYLASDDSRYVTGQVIHVNGGTIV